MGCSASAFATKEECDAGGAFCTFDDPFCTTNIGLIIGIVAGVFVFIVLVSIAVRCYFAQQAGGTVTGLFMGAPMNDNNTNNTNNNNFNVSSAPNANHNHTGGGWNSGNTMNNNNNNTGGWNAGGPSSPGGYGQQPAYPPPPPPPPGQYQNTFNQPPGGTAGQPAPDSLPAPSFVGYGSQPPNQAY